MEPEHESGEINDELTDDQQEAITGGLNDPVLGGLVPAASSRASLQRRADSQLHASQLRRPAYPK